MVRSSEIGDCTMPKSFSKKETFFFQQFKSYALVSPSKNWYHLGITFLYRRVSLCPLLATLAKYPTAK